MASEPSQAVQATPGERPASTRRRRLPPESEQARREAWGKLWGGYMRQLGAWFKEQEK